MNGKDAMKRMLSQYKVPRAKENEVSGTVLMGQTEMVRLMRKKTPLIGLMIDQLKYLSPLLWVTQFLAILLTGILSANLKHPYLEGQQILFSITPLLALLAVPELIKGAIHGMSELEHVCKNSVPKVLSVRLLAIGCINLAAITVVTVIISARYSLPFTQTILYGLVPFNIVNGFNMLVFDLFKVRSSFLAMAVSLCAAVLMKIITELSFFAAISEMTWSVLFWFTAVLLLAELFRFMRSMETREEYIQWN